MWTLPSHVPSSKKTNACLLPARLKPLTDSDQAFGQPVNRLNTASNLSRFGKFEDSSSCLWALLRISLCKPSFDVVQRHSPKRRMNTAITDGDQDLPFFTKHDNILCVVCIAASIKPTEQMPWQMHSLPFLQASRPTLESTLLSTKATVSFSYINQL